MRTLIAKMLDKDRDGEISLDEAAGLNSLLPHLALVANLGRSETKGAAWARLHRHGAPAASGEVTSAPVAGGSR